MNAFVKKYPVLYTVTPRWTYMTTFSIFWHHDCSMNGKMRVKMFSAAFLARINNYIQFVIIHSDGNSPNATWNHRDLHLKTDTCLLLPTAQTKLGRYDHKRSKTFFITVSNIPWQKEAPGSSTIDCDWDWMPQCICWHKCPAGNSWVKSAENAFWEFVM